MFAKQETTLNQPQVQQVHRLIGERLHRHRSASWEDDISRNAIDMEPFENLPAPSEFTTEALQETEHFWGQELAGKNVIEMAKKDEIPIPCPADREGYNPGQDVAYWINGLRDHCKIMDVVEQRGVEMRSYFDFGCATGRVLRHFAVQSATPVIWGSDINARHTRWLETFMPMSVRPLSNHCIPSLPIESNSVDVISAFSVFTHIDTFDTCWLAELNRILRPGGFAYLTIHNEATWEVLRGELDNEKNRLVQSILKIDPEFANYVHQPMPDQRSVYRFTNFGPYRAQVFHSNNYIRRVWGRFLEVEEILDCHHVRQSVVILSKKAA